MSLQTIYPIWLVTAPILLLLGWWYTRNSKPDYYRILLRSLIISISCGFTGFGVGHGSGFWVPWWAFLDTKYYLGGIATLIIWWIIVFIVYLVVHRQFKRIKSEKSKN